MRQLLLQIVSPQKDDAECGVYFVIDALQPNRRFLSQERVSEHAPGTRIFCHCQAPEIL